ncbi:hypothetical protein NDU88_006442 [Pleurodeles waltl]|uniref:Uncharacterized protein n=1 Tax=Pleurodeles waltl TaxID=8319 RepID=A0AAV7LQQ7_PLEWA|nr:hypothetical protein NDU88_006442 [Pleurodeles waltl]
MLIHAIAASREVRPTQEAIAATRTKIMRHVSKVIVARYQVYRSECYEYWETTGRHLANRIKQKAVGGDIKAIYDPSGQVHETPAQILEVFRTFYQDLNAEGAGYRIDRYGELLGRLATGRVTMDDSNKLESSILMEEIEDAM